MKIKIKNLKPNPFKKQIDGGKLNKEQIEKIKSSIKELGLMGSIPVFKKGKDYHSISHHHRIQAIKELNGKEFEVDVVVHNYTDDQALRGMVLENLTQRSDDFKEIVQNLKCVRSYLKKNKCSESEHLLKKVGRPPIKDAGSIRHISEWLNKSGTVLSIGSISEHLQVADNLSEELYNNIDKTHSGDASKRTDGKTISKSQAIILARFEDKKEQKDMAKALLTSKENRVRDQGKLVTEYKKSDDETKKMVRKGEIDIADVEIPAIKELTKLSNRKKTATEIDNDFVIKCGSISNEIPDLKEILPKLSVKQLEILYYYLVHWCKEDIAPLIKEVITQITNKQNNPNEENYVFEIVG